jgi:hypothetical protein
MINRKSAAALLLLVSLTSTVATGCASSNRTTSTPPAATVVAPRTTAPTAGTPTTTTSSSAPAKVTSPKLAVAKTTQAGRSGKSGASLGRLIHTGLDATPATEFAIQGVRVANQNQPGVTFGFELREYDNNGDHETFVLTTAVGDEKKPGFRAVEHAYAVDNDIQQPAFGYFVGHPTRITGTLRGKAVTAHTAVWSADRDVTVFWFDNTEVTGNDRLTEVQAYGTGNTRIAQATVYYE